MKHLAITIAALALVSCSREGQVQVQTKQTDYVVGSYITPLKVVEIDGCEYLFGDWSHSTVLTHKGNCKNPIHPEHLRK